VLLVIQSLNSASNSGSISVHTINNPVPRVFAIARLLRPAAAKSVPKRQPTNIIRRCRSELGPVSDWLGRLDQDQLQSRACRFSLEFTRSAASYYRRFARTERVEWFRRFAHCVDRAKLPGPSRLLQTLTTVLELSASTGDVEVPAPVFPVFEVITSHLLQLLFCAVERQPLLSVLMSLGRTATSLPPIPREGADINHDGIDFAVLLRITSSTLPILAVIAHHRPRCRSFCSRGSRQFGML